MRNFLPTLVLLSVMAFLPAACGEEPDDRIETITKLKVLAVKADKPELHPGETTRVHVLVGAPKATSISTFIVPFAQGSNTDFSEGEAEFARAGTTFRYLPGTTVAVPALDLGVPIPSKALPNTGYAMYQAPVTSGSYTLGAFVVEGVPDIQLGEGDPGAGIEALLDASLKALKTVRVRPVEETLNKNPVITRFRALKRWLAVKDGSLSGPTAPRGWVLGKGEVLRVEVELEDEDVDRASAVWWVTDGKARGYGRRDIDWVAPDSAGIETLTALVLDRIGGADWAFRDIAVGVDALKPDVVDAGAVDPMLVASGTRMAWLGFADAATAATVRRVLGDGFSIAVRGKVALTSEARLGWYLSEPAYLGAWETYAGPTTTVAEVGYPAGLTDIVLRVDAVVK